MGYINFFYWDETIYIIVFAVAVIMLLQTISKEEPLRVGTRDADDGGSSSSSPVESKEVHRSGEKIKLGVCFWSVHME